MLFILACQLAKPQIPCTRANEALFALWLFEKLAPLFTRFASSNCAFSVPAYQHGLIMYQLVFVLFFKISSQQGFRLCPFGLAAAAPSSFQMRP
jgi:hypothetical protein